MTQASSILLNKKKFHNSLGVVGIMMNGRFHDL
jgi:hypothetical protein